MRLSLRRLLRVVALASILGNARNAHAADAAADEDVRAGESCGRSTIGSVVQALEEQVIRFRAAGGAGAPSAGERDWGEYDLIQAAREVARLADRGASCEALRAAVGEVESKLNGLDVDYRQWLGWTRRLHDAFQARVEHEFLQIEALVHRLRREVGGAPTPPLLPPAEPIPAVCDDAEISRHARDTSERARSLAAALRAAGIEQRAIDADRIAERAREVQRLASAATSCDEIRYAVGSVERLFRTFEWHVALNRDRPARVKSEVVRLEAMVLRLRRLVGGRSIPGAP